MAEETNNIVETNQAAHANAQAATDEPKRLTLTGIEGDELDGEIEITDLPPIPWTRASLGPKVFNALARVVGAGDLKNQRNPSLDPRTFGISRARRLIQDAGLATPLEDAEQESARQAMVSQLLDQGAEIQKQLDAQLPARSGLSRRPGAPALTPAKTTVKQRPSVVRQG